MRPNFGSGVNFTGSGPAGNSGQCLMVTVGFLAILAYCFLQLAGSRIAV